MLHQFDHSVSKHYHSATYNGDVCGYHFHNSFEVIYAVEGNMNVVVNTVDIELNQGEILLISPAVVHSLDGNKTCKYFISIFTQDFVSEFTSHSMTSSFYHFVPDETIADMIHKYLINSSITDRYMIKSCLYGICSNALNNHIKYDSDETDDTFSFIVNKYISENFQHEIKRKDIADALNYEEHYFSYLFSKHMNTTFKKYLNIYKFAYAQNLLLTTNMPISQIAMDSGFSSIRSFNEVFKSLSGLSPTKFRATSE